MRTLYDITDEYKELLDLLQTTDADEEVIQTTIESTGLKDDFRNKVDSYLYVIDELEAVSKRIRKEEIRLAERRRMQERNVKRMKENLLDTMSLLEIPKEKTDRYTVWTQNNNPRMIVEDETKIPPQFFEEQPPKLNTKQLREYLKDREIDGVRMEQGRGVRFR